MDENTQRDEQETEPGLGRTGEAIADLEPEKEEGGSAGVGQGRRPSGHEVTTRSQVETAGESTPMRSSATQFAVRSKPCGPCFRRQLAAGDAGAS